MTKEAAATSIIMVPIEQIIPYEQNVKIHRSVQVRKVANSIESYGWDQPIVVDEGMVIIKGHARLAAAQLLELREVPVIVRTDLTEEEKRLSRIMDNKSAESEWDNEFLWQEISHLKSQGMKVQDLGFSDKNIVDMFPGRAQEVTKAPKEDIVHQTVAAGADGHDPTIPIIEVTIKPFRGEKAWLRRLSMVDYLNWHDRVFIGYSGGKDSFATLIWCLENVEREKINVFYSNLGWGVDWPHAIAYVFATEKMIGKRIFISGNANPHLFEQELLEMNYPHPASCWLRNKFKLPHVKGYYAQEKIGPKYGDPKEKVCHVLGVRWAEDATREKTYPDRGILEGMHYASPLIGWKDTDIVKFLGDRNLKIISAYATTNRLGCFMCPNAGRQEGINSRKKYPKLWKRVLEWIAMGARSDGRVANFHLVKYLTSLDDIPPEEKRARFDSFYSGSCFGMDEEEDWLEELFDSPLPTRPYLTIPYDPNLHPFRCDLKSEYLEMGEKDTETEVSLCML